MNHGGNVWQGSGPASWLDYSANIRPEGPPAWVREALLRAMDNVAYYPQLGMDRARAALGAYLEMNQQLVLPTAGGIAAIALAARLKASRVRIPAPAFLEYGQISERNGLTVERVPLIGENHEILPLTALGADLRENTCLWLCNPSNPVGAGYPREEVQALLDIVEARKSWLAVDEAFIEYCPENSVAQLVGEHPRLLVTGSMTKILGIPGVRLGYLCAGAAMEELAAYQDPWELNCFAESVLLSLPEHREDIREECERSRARRESFRAALEALGIFVYPSQSNFLLCDFGRDTRPIEEYLYEKMILVRRCLNFPGIDDGRHLRLAVKDQASNERFITTLEEAMQCAENH